MVSRLQTVVELAGELDKTRREVLGEEMNHHVDGELEVGKVFPDET